MVTHDAFTAYYANRILFIIQSISATDDMKYAYTLDCYNESGKKKELEF